MKLGLFIANLELLANEHGRDVEVTGALADEGLLSRDPDPPISQSIFVVHPATTENPVFLVLALCPDCGRPTSEHG